MNNMKTLNFSFNWNNKLDCKAFTTLRLSDRFKMGDEVEVLLNKKPIEGRHFVSGIKTLRLEEINTYIAYLDTGYSAGECKEILQKMYKKKNIDWTTQNIYFYLIVKE